MAISKLDLIKLADLAKLSFADDEFDTLYAEMDEIISFANAVNQSVDGDNDDIKFVSAFAIDADDMRDDVITPSLENERIISNVDGKDGFFSVKRCVQ